MKVSIPKDFYEQNNEIHIKLSLMQKYQLSTLIYFPAISINIYMLICYPYVNILQYINTKFTYKSNCNLKLYFYFFENVLQMYYVVCYNNSSPKLFFKELNNVFNQIASRFRN